MSKASRHVSCSKRITPALEFKGNARRPPKGPLGLGRTEGREVGKDGWKDGWTVGRKTGRKERKKEEDWNTHHSKTYN